jgi:crossover junction endodeoxyribonuclease RusA
VIELRVYGIPAPQGSKSAFVRGGKAVVVEGGSRSGRASHVAWRQAVATAARDWQATHSQPLLDEPVALEVTFRMPKPRSVPKYRLWPRSKPDLDKLIRSILDALSGVLIRDDAVVVQLAAEKCYGDPPGAQITLFPLGAKERRSLMR